MSYTMEKETVRYDSPTKKLNDIARPIAHKLIDALDDIEIGKIEREDDYLKTRGTLLYSMEELTTRDPQAEEQLPALFSRAHTIVDLLFDEMREKRYMDKNKKIPQNYSAFLDLLVAKVSSMPRNY